MIYPALQIGTQWVMVDKTRIPADREFYLDIGTHEIAQRTGGADKYYQKRGDLPIIAAFPKLEGVPLIPEYAFKNNSDLLVQKIMKAFSPFVGHDDMSTSQITALTFEVRDILEAAGGYTREDIFNYPEWLVKNEYFNYKSFDDTMRRATFELYLKDLVQSPTAFDCEENPDGSPKIENDTIVLKNVIRDEKQK